MTDEGAFIKIGDLAKPLPRFGKITKTMLAEEVSPILKESKDGGYDGENKRNRDIDIELPRWIGFSIFCGLDNDCVEKGGEFLNAFICYPGVLSILFNLRRPYCMVSIFAIWRSLNNPLPGKQLGDHKVAYVFVRPV